MTHQNESNPLDQMIQVLDEYGFDGMARAIQILVNEAMKIERSEVLGAQPYERTHDTLPRWPRRPHGLGSVITVQ